MEREAGMSRAGAEREISRALSAHRDEPSRLQTSEIGIRCLILMKKPLPTNPYQKNYLIHSKLKL